MFHKTNLPIKPVGFWHWVVRGLVVTIKVVPLEYYDDNPN